jgi:hypothetical protein
LGNFHIDVYHGCISLHYHQKYMRVPFSPHTCKHLSFLFFSSVFVVQEFELRAYALSHSTSPFLWRVFWDRVSRNYFPSLASNFDPPFLCLLSSWDYRHEPLAPGNFLDECHSDWGEVESQCSFGLHFL